MIRRPPRSTQSRSSAASDVYKRQAFRRHDEHAAARKADLRPTTEIGYGVAILVLAGKVVRDELPGLVCQERVDDGNPSGDGEHGLLYHAGIRCLWRPFLSNCIIEQCQSAFRYLKIL